MFYVLCFTWPEHWFTWNITNIYHSFMSNLFPVDEAVLCFMFYMYQVGISKPLSCFMFIHPLRHIGPSRFFVLKTLDYIKHKTYLGKLQGLKITKFWQKIAGLSTCGANFVSLKTPSIPGFIVTWLAGLSLFLWWYQLIIPKC